MRFPPGTFYKPEQQSLSKEIPVSGVAKKPKMPQPELLPEERAKNFKEVDLPLTLELIEAESIPAERLAGLIEQLVASGQGARALDMVMALAPELVRAGRHAEALPLLRAVAPAAKGNEDVRANLIECYRELNPRLRHLSACLDRSGIINDDDLAAAVAKLERLLSYKVGDYFYHSAGWGLGQIEAFDPLTAAATIDFEGKPGHTVPLETIETIFERLEPDDFRVLRKRDPEALRRLAEDDPAALVRKVLAAHDNRITVRTLLSLIHI